MIWLFAFGCCCAILSVLLESLFWRAITFGSLDDLRRAYLIINLARVIAAIALGASALMYLTRASLDLAQ